MTIQTPIIPDSTDLIDEAIRAMTLRRDALMAAHREIKGVYGRAFRAADGDLYAIITVGDALYRAMLGISPDDIDIIEQLSDHHRSVRPLDLIQLMSDVKGRATSVDLRMQRIQDRQQAAMRGARRREEERASGNNRRSPYTTAYEAAMRLHPSKRRMLAEALLES